MIEMKKVCKLGRSVFQVLKKYVLVCKYPEAALKCVGKADIWNSSVCTKEGDVETKP